MSGPARPSRRRAHRLVALLPSPYARARGALWLAIAVLAVGVGLQWGLALGLVVGGATAAAVLLWATPVVEPDEDDGRARR